MANITPQVIPTRYEFLTCLTENTEWTPDENGTYRITCIGKSADGGTGGARYFYSIKDGSGLSTSENYAGDGGTGGGAGGISRSIISLKKSDSIHCTINTNVTSFGEYLSATAGNGVTPGSGTGGNDFNTTGNTGGYAGKGVKKSTKNGQSTILQYPSSGGRGGGNGALGGKAGSNTGTNNGSGGGGGGGATYALPEGIAYDDPLYTTYIQRDLSAYSGGNGDNYNDATQPTAGQSYPTFSALNPVWYGGGNGGGGDGAFSSSSNIKPGGAGSSGSPGGILIEKGIFD